MMNGFGFGNGMGWGGGMNWGGGIVSILLLGVLIIGGIFFAKWLIRNPGKNGLNENISEALEMLNTRYAKGEITREEFLKIKSDLEEL
jgi:putative membrane protein